MGAPAALDDETTAGVVVVVFGTSGISGCCGSWPRAKGPRASEAKLKTDGVATLFCIILKKETMSNCNKKVKIQ